MTEQEYEYRITRQNEPPPGQGWERFNPLQFNFIGAFHWRRPKREAA